MGTGRRTTHDDNTWWVETKGDIKSKESFISIADIKNKVDIQDLLSVASNGVYEKAPSPLMSYIDSWTPVKCPFHVDENASASLRIKHGDQYFFCHACDQGGDVIGIVTNFLQMDIKEAIKYIIEEFGLRA